MHEPHFRPWGTVTPDYWVTSETRTEPVSTDTSSPTAVPQQAHAAEERATGAPATDAEQSGAGASAQAATPAAEAVGLPEGFEDRIASVMAAFNDPTDRERLAAAGVEAEKLDQEITEQYGQQHTHTVNIREIRGWLAHLAGQPEIAARWYLHTTGLQITLHGANHAHTEASIRRAVHTWQQVTDPAQVVQIGGDLAKAVAAVLGEGSDAARFVQARLSRRQIQH